MSGSSPAATHALAVDLRVMSHGSAWAMLLVYPSPSADLHHSATVELMDDGHDSATSRARSR